MTPSVPRTPFAAPVGPALPGGPTATQASAGSAPLSPPTVLAVGVTSLTSTSVTLVGSINTFGLAGTWWFEWGTSTQFGSVGASAAVTNTAVPQVVQYAVSGLTDFTTYYFALVGKTSGGTVVSFPLSFTTNGANPINVSSVAASPTATSATMPHFAWPFKIVYGTPHVQYGTQITSNDGAAVVEQDSDGDIFTCVAAIMNCNIGEWPEVPAFGIQDLTFSPMPLNGAAVASSVQRWEPRATVDLISELTSGDPGYGGDWTINTTIKA